MTIGICGSSRYYWAEDNNARLGHDQKEISLFSEAFEISTRIVTFLLEIDWLPLQDSSKNPNSIAILRCSQRITPYISHICGVVIFYSRLISLRILNF